MTSSQNRHRQIFCFIVKFIKANELFPDVLILNPNTHVRPVLYLVIPCYNEEKFLPITVPLFLTKINALISVDLISSDRRILFVNDGSKDRTWNIIQTLSQENPYYCGISLSRNRGHQNALLAGLMEARDRDITVSIDSDGQDDINAMMK